MIKEKRETHPNCIDLLEEREKEKKTPIVSQMEALARRIGFVPSRSEDQSTEEAKPMRPQPKQHNGLRCKKCFELLVRDDEFLFVVFLRLSYRYAGGLLLVNPIILVKHGWKGLHEKGGVVGESLYVVMSRCSAKTSIMWAD